MCNAAVESLLYAANPSVLGHISSRFSTSLCATCGNDSVNMERCLAQGCNQENRVSSWTAYLLSETAGKPLLLRTRKRPASAVVRKRIVARKRSGGRGASHVQPSPGEQDSDGPQGSGSDDVLDEHISDDDVAAHSTRGRGRGCGSSGQGSGRGGRTQGAAHGAATTSAEGASESEEVYISSSSSSEDEESAGCMCLSSDKR